MFKDLKVDSEDDFNVPSRSDLFDFKFKNVFSFVMRFIAEVELGNRFSVSKKAELKRSTSENVAPVSKKAELKRSTSENVAPISKKAELKSSTPENVTPVSKKAELKWKISENVAPVSKKTELKDSTSENVVQRSTVSSQILQHGSNESLDQKLSFDLDGQLVHVYPNSGFRHMVSLPPSKRRWLEERIFKMQRRQEAIILRNNIKTLYDKNFNIFFSKEEKRKLIEELFVFNNRRKTRITADLTKYYLKDVFNFDIEEEKLNFRIPKYVFIHFLNFKIFFNRIDGVYEDSNQENRIFREPLTIFPIFDKVVDVNFSSILDFKKSKKLKKRFLLFESSHSSLRPKEVKLVVNKDNRKNSSLDKALLNANLSELPKIPETSEGKSFESIDMNKEVRNSFY